MRLRDRLRRWVCRHRAYMEDMVISHPDGDRVVSVACCDCGKVLRTTIPGAGGNSLPVVWIGWRRTKESER